MHFSFRSPFSWIAVTKLWRAVPDLTERVELLPYYDPDKHTVAALQARGADFHYQQMSKAKHLYILYDVRRQVRKHGLSMTWPVDVDPWWELPHLAWIRATELGKGAEFYRGITAARWERGENICDPAVVAAVASAVGLPGDELAAAPEDPRLRGVGVDALVRAYEDDVFGVPYFRVGRDRFWGLDRVDDFVAVLTGEPASALAAPTPKAVADSVGAYDTDTAGGCG